MKIYIVGTGGVGGYFGGKLAQAGNDVTFISRGNFFNAMKQNGLTVNSVDGSFKIYPVQVIDCIDKIVNPDLIIFSVKTYDTETVAKQLKNTVLDKTIILTFQNGIDNDIKIGKYIKNNHIHPGIAYIISAKGEDGVINQTGGLKRLIFGSRKGQNNKYLKNIYEIFKSSKIDTILSENVETELWKKFIFINAFSGITAMCRATIGDIRRDKYSYDLYKRCVTETITVAKNLNIKLSKTIYKDIINITEGTELNSKSSLLIDIENSRKNEIEILNGKVVELADKLKIDVPINKAIYSSIKLLKQSNE